MIAQWHPDADLLADVAEGLADPTLEARVAAHLTDCPDCRALRGRLTAVSAALGSQPAPAMPDEVTARIMSALADEASSAAGVRTRPPADADTAPATASVTVLHPARRSRV